jgi:hypothetical protein
MQPSSPEGNTDWQFETYLPYLKRVGRQFAWSEGVHPNDVDDCEITFVERMLFVYPRNLRENLILGRTGWINVCARNHAKNFKRNATRHGRRTDSVKEQSLQFCEIEESKGDPETRSVRTVMFNDLLACIDCLKPEVREILIRHHVLEESVADVAAACQRTVSATEQALFRGRKAVREHLGRKGLKAIDFLDMLET